MSNLDSRSAPQNSPPEEKGEPDATDLAALARYETADTASGPGVDGRSFGFGLGPRADSIVTDTKCHAAVIAAIALGGRHARPPSVIPAAHPDGDELDFDSYAHLENAVKDGSED